MEHLFDKLSQYAESDVYPYHMPGHKRQTAEGLPDPMYRMDITEIDGFDNLHHAEGILLQLQNEAAKLCGAEESFYLVNGSTGGILAAISAAVPEGGKLLIARNCHKSVYHGAYLRNLRVGYIYPEIHPEFQINEAVTPAQVKAALDDDVDAVLIVSPTYEGRLADVKTIAEIVHAKNIPLIVDEAHGAHLGFANRYLDRHFVTACEAGADLVIQSTHKTLPALTQTALLHVNGSRIDREKLRRFLHIYQTSSPSYLLMASIDRALDIVNRNGAELFSLFEKRFSEMCKALQACRNLQILPYDSRQDIGKLLISTRGTDLSGKALYDLLLKKYRLQMELATDTYVLAMFSVADTEEGYKRLTEALLKIDGELEQKEINEELCFAGGQIDNNYAKIDWDCRKKVVNVEGAVGMTAADFVTLYPPGIPALVPGETITADSIAAICHWRKLGLTVEGLTDDRIRVKNEE